MVLKAIMKIIMENSKDMANEVINEQSEAIENSAEESVKPERNIVIEEAIEAILFAAGHPISYATLAKFFETTPTKMKDTVLDYSLKYNNSELPRGVLLLTYSDSCQLCTKQHYLTEIREALGIKKSGTLSTSALETLAIVAYNQPVTRIFVDTLRKVDSSYAMNSLIDRGLIECKGRLDVPGRPMLYGTTSDFLRSFGISSIEDLPRPGEDVSEVFSKTHLSNTEEELKAEQLEILPLAEKAEEAEEEEAKETVASDNAIEDFSNDDSDPSAEDDILEDLQ